MSWVQSHYTPEDFILSKPEKKGQEPQRQNPKRTAVPVVSEGRTDAAEVTLFVFIRLKLSATSAPRGVQRQWETTTLTQLNITALRCYL